MLYLCYMNAPEAKAREAHPSNASVARARRYSPALVYKSMSLSPSTLALTLTLFKRRLI